MHTGDTLSDDAQQNQEAHLDLIPFGKLDPLAVSIIGANIQAVLGLYTDTRTHR
jgi:hypothetical protein